VRTFFGTRRPSLAAAIQRAQAHGVALNGPPGIAECRALLEQHANGFSEIVRYDWEPPPRGY
jgi:hypothetical protein